MSAAASPAAGLTIGIDVGGTKTAAVVTDAADRLLYHAQERTQRERLVDQLIEMVRQAALAAAPMGGATAVAIAAPGHVDRDTGSVYLAVNLGSAEVELAAPISAACGLPCYLEHDTRAAAMWLYAQSAAEPRAPRGLAYLALGTGVSAGVVIDGVPVRGARGLAGEVGHIVADPAGPICSCGLRGCLETFVSGPRIAHRAGTATAQAAFALAAAGDAKARRVVEDASRHLARAIRGLVLAFGVERVLVGGGVAGAGDGLRLPLMEAVAVERHESALVDRAFAAVHIELLPPELLAGARGAALIARRAVASHEPAMAGGRG